MTIGGKGTRSRRPRPQIGSRGGVGIPSEPVRTAVARRAASPPLQQRKPRASGTDLANKLGNLFDPAAQKARDNARSQRTFEDAQIVTLSQQLRDERALSENLRTQVSTLRDNFHNAERARERAEMRLEMQDFAAGRDRPSRRSRSRSPRPSRSLRPARSPHRPRRVRPAGYRSHKRVPGIDRADGKIRVEQHFPEGGRMTTWHSDYSTDDFDEFEEEEGDENEHPRDAEYHHMRRSRSRNATSRATGRTPTPGPSRIPSHRSFSPRRTPTPGPSRLPETATSAVTGNAVEVVVTPRRGPPIALVISPFLEKEPCEAVAASIALAYNTDFNISVHGDLNGRPASNRAYPTDSPRCSMDTGEPSTRGKWLCRMLGDYGLVIVNGVICLGPQSASEPTLSEIVQKIKCIGSHSGTEDKVSSCKVEIMVQGYAHATHDVLRRQTERVSVPTPGNGREGVNSVKRQESKSAWPAHTGCYRTFTWSRQVWGDGSTRIEVSEFQWWWYESEYGATTEEKKHANQERERVANEALAAETNGRVRKSKAEAYKNQDSRSDSVALLSVWAGDKTRKRSESSANEPSEPPKKKASASKDVQKTAQPGALRSSETSSSKKLKKTQERPQPATALVFPEHEDKDSQSGQRQEPKSKKAASKPPVARTRRHAPPRIPDDSDSDEESLAPKPVVFKAPKTAAGVELPPPTTPTLPQVPKLPKSKAKKNSDDDDEDGSGSASQSPEEDVDLAELENELRFEVWCTRNRTQAGGSSA
ncbi:hypothetical protein B0H13DRAFT_2481350 [Mycena leptocephala]|nr:hypothetical protein B0H13DRAFT_2481350 [Mycena leptocephala]